MDDINEIQNPFENELRLIFGELSQRIRNRIELTEELHINGFDLISVVITQADADGGVEQTTFQLNITQQKLQALKALQGEQGGVVKAIIDDCIIKNQICKHGSNNENQS